MSRETSFSALNSTKDHDEGQPGVEAADEPARRAELMRSAPRADAPVGARVP